MAHSRPILLAAVLLALPLAGCFGGDELPSERTFSATGGTVTAGWAYDGQSVIGQGTSVSGTVNNPENTGTVTASFTIDGKPWTITFNNFAEASGKEFMNGGIAFDLNEHGDTGVADTSIPAILARIAAWGTATVTRDGEPVLGRSGNAEWSAHLMVSDTTVRGADGKITKADGTTPYDPASPADARRIEGDPQAFLWVKSPDGEDARRAAQPVTASLTCAGPTCSTSTELSVEKGANLLLNFTVNGGSNPIIGAGNFAYRVLDADQNVLANGQGQLTPPNPVTGVIDIKEAPGPLKLEVTGAGAFTFAVAGEATYADQPFIVITWNDVTLS